MAGAICLGLGASLGGAQLFGQDAHDAGRADEAQVSMADLRGTLDEDATPPAGDLLLRATLDAVAPSAARGLGRAADYRKELECLTQAVYYEARGETAAGQAAVAQVVMNRVRHPGFPKSICGVVYQGAGRPGCQFSFTCNGALGRGHEAGAWKRARTVAVRALSGFVMAEVGAATHFHAVAVSPDWGRSLTRVAKVGLHVFYRAGGHGAAAPRPSVQVASARPTAPAPEAQDGEIEEVRFTALSAGVSPPDHGKGQPASAEASPVSAAGQAQPSAS